MNHLNCLFYVRGGANKRKRNQIGQVDHCIQVLDVLRRDETNRQQRVRKVHAFFVLQCDGLCLGLRDLDHHSRWDFFDDKSIELAIIKDHAIMDRYRCEQIRKTDSKYCLGPSHLCGRYISFDQKDAISDL